MNQVFFLKDCWKVLFNGIVCSPDFQSKGAALAYLSLLENGYRKPEIKA